MLPSAVAQLLPTPTAEPYGSNQSPSPGAAVRPSLDTLVALLPTPVTTDAVGARNCTANRRPGAAASTGTTLTDALHLLLPTPDTTHGRRTTRTAPLLPGVVDALLPTPEAKNAAARQDYARAARQDYARADRPGSGGPDLVTAVALLPTPSAGDGDRNRRATAGATPDGWRQIGLADALLPTPTAAAAAAGHAAARGGARAGELLLGGVARAAATENGVDWRQYTAAVRRWEALTRPAPVPWERGPRGGLRLTPALPEWMMDYPQGWVTDVPGLARTEQLRLLGNGVVHSQAVAALHVLLPIWQHAIEDASCSAG